MKDINKVKQGKKNRKSGAAFELFVRKDLESKGWIVSKWMNQVECEIYCDEKCTQFGKAKLIPAKHKFCGAGRPMAIGTGFPDFVCFKMLDKEAPLTDLYEVIGVEVKSNGYLDKEEKEKCEWYLKNNIFSKILIASKGEKRGTIKYKEFEIKNE